MAFNMFSFYITQDFMNVQECCEKVVEQLTRGEIFDI
jgi:hypothetical protein